MEPNGTHGKNWNGSIVNPQIENPNYDTGVCKLYSHHYKKLTTNGVRTTIFKDTYFPKTFLKFLRVSKASFENETVILCDNIKI